MLIFLWFNLFLETIWDQQKKKKKLTLCACKCHWGQINVVQVVASGDSTRAITWPRVNGGIIRRDNIEWP